MRAHRDAGSAHARLAQFIVAGGIGFAVDAFLLLQLAAQGWTPFSARLVSFLGAVSVTWLINRRGAFGDRRAQQAGAAAGEYSRYLIAQSLGAGINLAVFAVTLWLLPSLREQLILPLAVGSICALFFNYAAMHCYVFPQRTTSATPLTKNGPKQPA